MTRESDAFLAALEPVSHAERVRGMIDLGKAAHQDGDAQGIILALAGGDFYERYLALYSCYGSHDGAHALRALDDKSAVIRGLAIRLSAILGDAAQLQRAMSDFPRVCLALAWRLRQHGKTAIIDMFLESGALSQDRRFYSLLPLSTRRVVARYAGDFPTYAGGQAWSHLARFHPDIAVAVLDAWSQETPHDAALIASFNRLLPSLQSTQSERVVAIADRLLQHASLNEIRCKPLLSRQPEAVVDMLLAHATQIPYAFRDGFAQVVTRLRDDQITRLLALDEQAFGYDSAAWFARLPEQRRVALFSVVRPALLHHYNALTDTLQESVLEVLPADQREPLVRAILDDTRLGDDRFRYAYLLPWHEMRDRITDYLHTPVIQNRMLALSTLINNVRFQREHLADALALLQERRMEADFMRRHIFTQLGTLPGRLWHDEHLTSLAEIIQHGLRDVGLSGDTQKAMLHLLTLLLPRHVAWSLGQIELILRDRGFARPTKATSPLIAVDGERLVARLTPVMAIWQQQEKAEQILDVIDYYLPSGRLPETVIALLTGILGETTARVTVERILTLMSKRQALQAADVVPALLQADASFITFQRIADHILYYRQDLAAPFLHYVPYQGRFATGRQRFLPRLTRRFAGGSTQQQTRYLAALQAILADPNVDVRMTTHAIKQMAFLPAARIDAVSALAQRDDTIVRTTALFTLGRRDTEDGIPVLIAALQDSRVRIAINVLRPFLRRMPADAALVILQGISMNRVTVSKEIIRLIAGLGSPAALRELLTREALPLHKDVRLVLLKELWRYRGDPDVLAVFTRVAQSPDAELAVAAIPPYDHVNSGGRRWVRTLTSEYLGVLALLLRHPAHEVQEQAIRASQTLTARDVAGICVPQLFALVAERRGDACQSPARALLLLCTERDHPAISDLVRARLADRPSLASLVKAVNSIDDDDRADFAVLYRLFLAELARDPLTVEMQIDLAGQIFSREELITFFKTLAGGDALHARALMAASTLIDRALKRFTLADLLFLEMALADSDDERLRYLAFALLKEQADRADAWSPERRERLEQYRADASSLIASEAQFFFPEGDDV